MTTCPVCHGPMTLTRPNGRPRTYCSHACALEATRARQADVDQAAVWRLTRGEPVASTCGERIAACAILRDRGRSYAQIADTIRVTDRTVARYVAQLRNKREAA